MIFLCISLLLLHQGYAKISVTTVQLGDPATFTCDFPDSKMSSSQVKWYRQSIGESLTLIATVMKGNAQPTFEQGFSPSQFSANHTKNMSALTILKTIPEDEAVYHCAVIITWYKDEWSGTYLSLKGKTRGTTDSTIVQWPTVSDPVNPGDSVTFQCSVLFDSEKKSCPDEYRVYWFGVRSSLPNIIYTDGNRPDECETRSNTQKSCVYHFSKTVNASDAGTYYCAVAACGEILFGYGTKLDIEETGSRSFSVLVMGSLLLFLLFTILVVNVVAILAIKKKKCDQSNQAAVFLLENVAQRNLKRNEDPWIYSTVVFTIVKTGSGGRRDAKAAEKERICAAAEAFGLDKH